MWILTYLLIGVVLSAGVGIYTYVTRRAYHFQKNRTLFVFLVFIPLGWPYIIYLILQDLLRKKF